MANLTDALYFPPDKMPPCWQPNFDGETPRDRFDRKMAQADCLAKTLIGEGGDSFRMYNDSIQEHVLWLLSDLITEARLALREAEGGE
jgi:hypothetical protein